MSRDTAARDVTLNALTVLTGGLTAAAFVGTGLVTGLAAEQTAQKAHAKAVAAAHISEVAAAAQLQAEIARRSVPTPRPTRTVVTTSTLVTTEYIQAKPTYIPAKATTRRSSQRQSSNTQSSNTQSRSGRTSWAPVRTQTSARTYAPPPAPVRAPARRAYVPPPAPSAAS